MTNKLQLQIWDEMALSLPLLLSPIIVPLTFLRSTITRYFIFLSQILLFHLLIDPKQTSFFFFFAMFNIDKQTLFEIYNTN